MLLCLLVVAPQQAFPPVDQSRLYKRTYRITNIGVPVGLLPHGLRQHFVQQMSGRDVEGSVQRVVKNDFGQHIKFSVTGTVATLNHVANTVLNDERWDYVLEDEQPRTQTTTSRRFVIISSTRGADCGANSNKE